MALKEYSADQVLVSVAGIPLQGFADGEFLTISFTSDHFESVAGADGEVTRSKTNDNRATVTVKLMQTSDSNDLLSALYNTDRKFPNGAGVGAFLVQDFNGRSLFAASECWIRKVPDISFDRTATEREWTFEIANLEYFQGGN